MKVLLSFSSLFSLLLSIAVVAPAQSCNTATCTASSASESDVLAAFPSSSNTNPTVVVNIPSGTGTWTSGFSFRVPSAVTSLTIQGATSVNCTGTAGTSSYACTATDNTVLVDSYNAPNGALMNITIPSSVTLFRMTGLTFQGGTITSGNNKPDGFLHLSGTSAGLRIDHSHFNTNAYSISNAGGGMTIYTNLYGVIDHSLFELSGQNNGIRDYAGSADFGDTNWSQPTNFGSSGFLFAENNVFSGGASNDCDEGGKMVMRYNTIIANPNEGDTGLWQGHQMGQGTQRSRGCRALEIYHNYVSNPNPSNNQYADGDGGSGTGLVWNNTITAGYSQDVIFENDRESATGHSQTAAPNGIGYCGNASSGSTSPWDGNGNSTTGYPCINQTGRGQGDLLNGQNFPNALNTATNSASWPHNLREPWYVWNENIAAGNACYNPAWNGVSMQPDQAFYCQTPSFNGTSGTGSGLLANRPTTCTAGPGGTYDTSPTGSYGVGYFATDVNSGKGELYVCTATNTWTGIYQPYTYPHPLLSGASTTSTSPPAPTGLVGTVY